MAPLKEWFGAYNIIFKWFEEKYGYNALDDYWRIIAKSCFPEVVERFRNKGLEGIGAYFEQIIDRDGGNCSSEKIENKCIVHIHKCPELDILNVSENKYLKPIDLYCRHHEIINTIIANEAKFSFRMDNCDGKGSCKWTFSE